MSFSQSKWFKIAIILFIIYAIMTYRNENQPKVVAQNSLPANSGINSAEQKQGGLQDLAKELNVKIIGDNKDKGFIQSKIEEAAYKWGQTQTGKTVLEAIAKKNIDEKMAKSDINALMAQNKNEIIISDIQVGGGKTAFCGSSVKIDFVGKFDDVEFVNNNKKPPLVIKLGARTVISGLEQGIIGMRVGGARKIGIPSNYAFDDTRFVNDLVPKGKSVMYEVILKDIEPDNNPDFSLIKIRDENFISDKPKILCGSDIIINYIVKDTSNLILLKGQKLKFKIGDNQLPVGIERGLIGAREGSKRYIRLESSVAKFLTKPIITDMEKLKDKETIWEIEIAEIRL